LSAQNTFFEIWIGQTGGSMNNLIFIWTHLLFGLKLLLLVHIVPTQQTDADLIKKFLIEEFGEPDEFPRRFIYDKFDLNGDGNPEILVGLIGPDFCGSGGCTMLVVSDQMKILTRVTLVQYPVYIGTEEKGEVSKGYRHLLLRTGKVGYVKLVWDGKTYPSNPSMQTKIEASIIDGRTKYLNAEDEPGFVF
jgi:hypothetical protein